MGGTGGHCGRLEELECTGGNGGHYQLWRNCGVWGTGRDWELLGVTEGVTGGYWRVAGVTGRCCGLTCLCVSRNVPPGIPRPLNSPCVAMGHPVPPSCVSLCPSGVPRDVPMSPTAAHVSLGMSAVASPGCLSSPPVSPWVSHKMSLFPCIPPMDVPCASCVSLV